MLNTDEEKLEAIQKVATEGLHQITLKRYDAILKQYPHTTCVTKVGVGFCGKMACAFAQRVDLATQQESAIVAALPNDDDDL